MPPRRLPSFSLRLVLTAFDPLKTNNFDLLRLWLASLVVLGHSRLLLGIHHPAFPFNGAAMAVDGFFVVSGFLIAASYDRDSALLPYLIRRAFRIYPLYAVVVVAQLIGMVAVAPPTLHIGAGEIIRYLACNLAFLNFLAHDVGHLLAHNSDPGINPSLWTLKVEVGFYLAFPLLWWGVRRAPAAALLGIFLASSAYALHFSHGDDQQIGRQLPGVLRFFAMGMAMYRYRAWLQAPRWLGWALVVPLYAMTLSAGLRIDHLLFYPFVVAAFIYAVGFLLPPVHLPRDFSYGVYLVHGPLIQLGILTALYRGDVATSLALYAIVFVTAVVAETLIEVPAIKLGRVLARRVRPPAARLPAA